MRAKESLHLEAGVRREGQEGASSWGGCHGVAARGTKPPGRRQWSAKSWPREGGLKGMGETCPARAVVTRRWPVMGGQEHMLLRGWGGTGTCSPHLALGLEGAGRWEKLKEQETHRAGREGMRDTNPEAGTASQAAPCLVLGLE